MSENKLGALWVNKSQSGKEYMSGEVNDIKVVIFKNDYKKESKHPDYIVYAKTGAGQKEETPPTEEREDDIPF